MILSYYHNQIVPWDELPLPLFQRAIFYGESLFTSFRTHGQRFLFIKDHIERLLNDCKYLYFLENSQYLDELSNYFIEGIRALKNNHFQDKDCYFRLMILTQSKNQDVDPYDKTLNIVPLVLANDLPEISYDPLWANTSPKNCLIKYSTKTHVAEYPHEMKRGNYALSFHDIKKYSSPLHNEIIYISANNKLLSGTTSNLFLIRRGEVLTPKLNSAILNGITRAHLIKCLQNNNFSLKIKDISKKDLLEAQEVFLTNSLKGIIPVKNITDDSAKTTIHKSSIIIEEITEIFREYCKNHLYEANSLRENQSV